MCGVNRDGGVFSIPLFSKNQKKNQKKRLRFSKHETQKNVMNVSRMWKKRRLKDYLQNLKTFVFFFPRVKSERNTEKKQKKKDSTVTESLECLTKLCRTTLFFFPLLKNKHPTFWNYFFLSLTI